VVAAHLTVKRVAKIYRLRLGSLEYVRCREVISLVPKVELIGRLTCKVGCEHVSIVCLKLFTESAWLECEFMCNVSRELKVESVSPVEYEGCKDVSSEVESVYVDCEAGCEQVSTVALRLNVSSTWLKCEAGCEQVSTVALGLNVSSAWLKCEAGCEGCEQVSTVALGLNVSSAWLKCEAGCKDVSEVESVYVDCEAGCEQVSTVALELTVSSVWLPDGVGEHVLGDDCGVDC
jgi:hypothetical protein